MLIINGNIFDTDADIILHQVNCQGKMGSGIAKQVRERYPWVYAYYRDHCADNTEDTHKMLGYVQPVYINERQRIINLFAQDKYGYDGQCYTDYKALRLCLEKVNMEYKGLKVAIPYLMGCYRGGGDWSFVSKMIEETLTDCEPVLYRYDRS